MRRFHLVSIMGLLLLPAVAPSALAFSITLGDTWDGPTLQEILDERYGVGAVNALTDYQGASENYGFVPFWVGNDISSLLITELAGNRFRNELGWYQEEGTLRGSLPSIDGIGDGVLLQGWHYNGSRVAVDLPPGIYRFGFYLNPNGEDGTTHAPPGEHFFTNRFHNDVGPDGSGAVHAPFDGDVQVLVYDVTHLHEGVPTFLLAWEDRDSGSPLSAVNLPGTTDNDYNDFVVEISAGRQLRTEASSFGGVKALFR